MISPKELQEKKPKVVFKTITELWKNMSVNDITQLFFNTQYNKIHVLNYLETKSNLISESLGTVKKFKVLNWNEET